MTSQHRFLLTLTIGTLSAWAHVVAAEPALDELLKEYRALGLPEPPANAKFVRAHQPGVTIINGEKQPIRYTLGFEVPPVGQAKPRFFFGTGYWADYVRFQTQEVSDEPEKIRDIEVDTEDALNLAIHCHAKGLGKLAKYFHVIVTKDAGSDPKAQLLRDAWYHWLSQVTEPKSDRVVVLKHLKELIGKVPETDTVYNQRLLISLEKALAPSKAKPGSVEAKIDRLVDHSRNTDSMMRNDPGDAYWEVVELGFDAIPTLIAHLDDDRLTRSETEGFNNFRSWNRRVGDVVGDILEGIAGEEIPRGTPDHDVGGGWLRRLQGYPLKNKAVNEWWKRASQEGEKKYVLSRVIPAEDNGQPQVRVNDHMLRVIVKKYPAEVPSLYKKVLQDRPKVESWELADAIRVTKLSSQEQIELLTIGTKHKEFKHRVPALIGLHALDAKVFVTRLLEAINDIPKDVSAEYWSCSESRVAGLVVETDDRECWQAVEKVARRSSLGLRMEILHRVAGYHESEKIPRKVERLRLLANFLDDDAVRDTGDDKRLDGPGAGFPYETIECRNSVAIDMAGLLGIEIPHDDKRSSAEWAKLREQVRAAAKRELETPKK